MTNEAVLTREMLARFIEEGLREMSNPKPLEVRILVHPRDLEAAKTWFASALSPAK